MIDELTYKLLVKYDFNCKEKDKSDEGFKLRHIAMQKYKVLYCFHNNIKMQPAFCLIYGLRAGGNLRLVAIASELYES